MNAVSVAANTIPLVNFMRQSHPDMPIVLVEGTPFGRDWACPDAAAQSDSENAALTTAYNTLIANGTKALHYVSATQLFSPASLLDSPCANGLHPTDQGMRDVADFWVSFLPTVLGQRAA
jgi:hypothetical protein